LGLSSFIDISHSENLHWLALCGSSIILSSASSVVPNYLESRLEPRTHNRARLLNETAARVHIAYFIFLVALITSDDIDKKSWIFTCLVALTAVIVFVLIVAIIVSGSTRERINKSTSNNITHQCELLNGVCTRPLGVWLYCKITFFNTFVAVALGAVCLWLCVSPTIIQHGKQAASDSELLQNQRKEYFDIFQRAYKQVALQTKEEFETTVIGVKDAKYRDAKLNVSYWISHEDTLYQLGNTEDHPVLMKFPLNKKSVIGCGFAHQNHSVEWDNTIGKGVVVSFNENPPFEDPDCRYAPEEQRKLKSIFCASYNANGPPETTVGICIFTESDRKIFVNNYHGFIRVKVEEFYKQISPALQNSYIVPH
jgi:hypothetical protein